MAEKTAIQSLIQQITPTLSAYNELFLDGKKLRPEWEAFFTSLHQLGFNELQNRTADILRLLKENGVAYNIYNDPSGQSRPWELDPVPFIINSQEWESINAGLIQRAELFDLILKDIYGEQKLIKDGIIPQELVYLHPGFIRQCVNMPMRARHLTLYAADIARGHDGRFWIISDRTQAPSGSGYALENRFAMSSVLPELFTNQHIKRLSPYFDALQYALMSMAPHNTDNPRIVILTPGPDNETYFEHSYLAAYLGLTLVQGNDLMVKDNYVWLKTIDGLEKVDVILRRVDDIYCDPLELKSDSLLGVPGLLQAVRKGNVAIANPLGSSIVENTGLVPFLPAISKYFFNKDLIMPSIATWWCGQSKEMKYVIENIDKLVVRKTFRDTAGTRSTFDGTSLSAKEKEELKKLIQENPYLFTGQEKIDFSSAPSFSNGKILSSHSLFRSFLVSYNNSYMLMPGGLTRSTKNNFLISNQLGGISKDTWVISSNEETEQPVHVQLHTDGSPGKYLKRSLPSHTAENLFWVGRYTERVISNARMQRTVMQKILQSKASLTNEGSDIILLKALTQCTYTYPGFFEEKDAVKVKELYTHPWKELTDVLFNEKRNGSLSNNISLLKNAVYSVRNFWATDTWRVLLQMDETWKTDKAKKQTEPLNMLSTIDSLNTSMFAFLGMNRESVRREQGWNIMDLGRKIEQSLHMIVLLKSIFDCKQNDKIEYELLESLLTASQSLITYRYTYRDHLQVPLTLELLMLDNNYPKSLAYLVKKIKRYVAELPKEGKELPLSAQQKLIEEADLLLKLADVQILSQTEGIHKEYKKLHQFLDKLYQLIADTSTLVSKTYFRHSQMQKQLFTANLI